MRHPGKPLVRQFPEAARFLDGMHQDFEICYRDMADYARFASRASEDAHRLARELGQVAALSDSDLKSLWHRSRAEVMPRRVQDMRRLLRQAVTALETGV